MALSQSKQNLIIIALVVGPATAVFAFELHTLAGRQRVEASDIIAENDGHGTIYSGAIRVGFDPQSVVSLGAFYNISAYEIDGEEALDGTTTAKTGSLNGNLFGPEVMVVAPLPYVTPYLRFAYQMGDYYLRTDSNSSFTSDSGAVLETLIETKIDMSSKGLVSAVGLRIGGAWALTIEALEMRETLTVDRVSLDVENRQNGTKQPQDSKEEQLDELFQGLVGEKYHHSTRTTLIGVLYEW